MKRFLACVLLTVAALPIAAQDVYRYSNAGEATSETQDTLEVRFEWAQDIAANDDTYEYWVAYTIQRTMNEGSPIGSWGSGTRDLPPLGQVLTGTPVQRKDLQHAARKVLDQIDGIERRVQKEVAVLARVRERDREILEVDLSSIDLSFDFEALPVFWLGASSDSQSIAWLEATFRASSDDDLREDIVSAVGMHDDAELVLPFVLHAADESFADDIRQNAVFWLGRYETSENVRRLFGLAQNDASDDVRDAAVFALNRMSVPVALDQLITLARTGQRDDVRENARFWLGQKASHKLVPSEPPETDETEIQKQALMALTRLDDDEGVPALIDLAKTHRNPAIRKQAVFWLGQSDDERALETIVSILKGS